MPAEDSTGERLSSAPPSTTRSDFSRRAAIVIICLACAFYGLYAGSYIRNTSFVVNGQRYFCLFDDAMISMRYAHNWVDGHGLTWNPGELVEGYSNFLWTAVMAGVHLLSLEDRLTSLAVQVLCVFIGWGYVWGTYLLGRALRLDRAVSVAGAVVTALYFSLTLWNLQGMETGFLTCLAVWAAAVCARAWRRGRISWAGGVLLGAVMLSRLDGLIIVAAIYVLFALRLRRVWAASTLTLAVALLIGLAYWLWRWQYYDDFWPNTYYLKLGIPVGFRLSVLGLDYLSSTVYRLGFPFLCVLVGVIVALRERARWELIGVFLVCVAYMLWVGGDAWPYDRFICPALPFAALGIMHGVARLVKKLAAIGAAAGTTRHAGLTLAVAILLAVGMNFSSLRDWVNAIPYYRSANHENVLMSKMVERNTEPEARIAVFWAGTMPYFTGRYAIDILGKSDLHVARKVLPRLERGYPPGHNKYDLRYSLLEQRADVVDMPGGRLWPDLTREPWFRRAFRPQTGTMDGIELVLYVRADSGLDGP